MPVYSTRGGCLGGGMIVILGVCGDGGQSAALLTIRITEAEGVPLQKLTPGPDQAWAGDLPERDAQIPCSRRARHKRLPKW